MQVDVNIEATDGHSALQGAHVVRPLIVSEYAPLDIKIWPMSLGKAKDIVNALIAAGYSKYIKLEICNKMKLSWLFL